MRRKLNSGEMQGAGGYRTSEMDRLKAFLRRPVQVLSLAVENSTCWNRDDAPRRPASIEGCVPVCNEDVSLNPGLVL